jgi:uncharacterized protein (TIGR03437 family)
MSDGGRIATKLIMFALAALAFAIPLHFEQNQGQLNPHIRFSAVTNRYTLELSDTAIAMNFPSGSVFLNLPRTKPEGADEMAAKSNYYFGSDPSKWSTGISNFARVRYRHVFPGVDLALYGTGERIEYDWIVAPGADPRLIRFSFTGASKMRVDPGGDLILETGGGEVRHTRPRIRQSGREIAGRFVLNGDEVRFEIGPYDKRRPLTIDPVLLVNRSFGGSGVFVDTIGYHASFNDTGTGIATDGGGNIYVTGTTFSADFPLANSLEGPPGPPSQSCGLVECQFNSVFVTKLSPDGGTLLYSTYIGAPSTRSQGVTDLPLLPAAIAVDAGGTVYIAGATSGANFPGVTATAGGNDAFLLRLSPQGVLIGTLLFGGSADDAGTSVVLGPDGFIYLAGTTQSSNFPVTREAYRAALPGSSSAFLVKIGFNSPFGPTNGAVLYSTYVGPGTSAAVAADAGGNAYIAAATTSTAWPTTSGVAQPACAGTTCADIVVAKLDPLGQRLIYATYLGGSKAEAPGGIAVDASGSAYVTGATYSPDFPVTPGAFETHSNVDFSHPYPTGFVAKLSPDASRFVYATYLGGSASDRANTISVDAAGSAYVGGNTTSPDFPLLQAIQSTPVNAICQGYTPSGTIPSSEFDCASGGFLSVLNPSGTALVWSTYLGSGSVDALALDPAGNVYATGVQIEVNGPSMGGAIGVLKIAPGVSPLDVPANSFMNAASYAPGLPLKGGLASLFLSGLNIMGTILGSGSPLPTDLAGVSILVGGARAPILFVTPLASGMQQIDFQVPFEAASNSVEIRYQGSSTSAFPQTAPPGIFTLSDGTPAIQHSTDYSLVTPSNPAHPGETIIVYATGLGPVSPAVASGVAATGPAPIPLPSSSACGGISTGQSTPPYSFGSILYAGLTPGFVGLYQLNIQIPQSQPAGTAQFSIDANICDLLPAGGLQSNIVNLPVQ